jgi:hypothetical protein
MKQKTENKIKIWLCLAYANLLIWNFAQAEFKDWTKDIAPGLSVIDSKIGLDGVYIPEMIYEPTLDTETTDEANNKQLEEANTEEIKEVAEKVPAHSDDQPRWKIETVSPSSSVEDLIRKYFPDNADNMIKLFTCESGLEPHKVGDKTLTFKHNGEILGSSHGIAQIRTGGNDNGIIWNRAEANGMTVKEFQNKLHDPEYNLNYAKKIFDSRGYSAWYNCARRNNLIK